MPMSRVPDHRCPDCHLPLHGAEAVTAHRELAQGDCFAQLRSEQRRRIIRYRAQFDITPPPMPADPYEDGVIE